MNHSSARDHSSLPLVLLVLAFVGYLVPWLVAPSAPMTLNAHDLAEWVSLYPAQHHTSPPLLAPLLLRLQLVILTLALGALPANKSGKLVAAIIIVVLAIGQLPPPEYVHDIGNLNYRQQFGLATTSLIAGLFLLRVRHSSLQLIFLIVSPLVGILAALAGMSQAYDVYMSLHTNGTIGLGLWILIASYAGLIATVFAGRLRRPRAIS